VKAHPVPGLDPELPLAVAAREIIAVRSAELFSFVPRALDERNPVALHDMRIAAKRLRYVLELVGFAIGPLAQEAEARARDLQTVIGEVHDQDVLIARLEALPAKTSRVGLRALSLRLQSVRDERFARFLDLWATIEEAGLRERLGAVTSFSPNGSKAGDN
jgi:CHAD domain-containing protein